MSTAKNIHDDRDAVGCSSSLISRGNLPSYGASKMGPSDKYDVSRLMLGDKLMIDMHDG